MSSEVTSVILLGLGCAANPWGIMVAVLLLNARRGLWIVWAYVVAWVVSITVVMAFLLAGFGSLSTSTATTSSPVRATTSTMPAPIVPSPMTPTLAKSRAALSTMSARVTAGATGG